MQSRNAERLVQQVNDQSRKMEQNLDEIHSQISKASTMERVSTAAKGFVQHNDAIMKLLHQVESQVTKHSGIINKYTLGALVLSFVLLWRYRATISDRTSENVADLASKTLQQETLRETIQETLDALATSPDTLETLNELLQTLIQDAATQQQLVNLVVYAVGTPAVQKALLELLQVAFTDPYLQELTGLFLLKGLDVPHVRKRLEEQTQALVRETVSNEAVQRATGIGIQKSLKYAVIPPFLKPKKEERQGAASKEADDFDTVAATETVAVPGGATDQMANQAQ